MKWEYKIGDIIKDQNRNMKINNKKICKRDRKDYVASEKWYEYQCLICGWNNGEISETNLKKGTGCSCCSGRTAVKGINTLGDFRPDLISYFDVKDDAFKYTLHSGKYCNIHCIKCGYKKTITVDQFVKHGFSCPICTDGKSYPEKFIMALLIQLNVSFKTQANKTLLKWCKKYIYDFYFKYNNKNIIIETHGEQHYKDTKIGQKLEDIQINDNNKKELAYINGYNDYTYIVLDCRKSNIEWIKKSIINSELSKMYDLSNIDWKQCDEYATKNLLKEACFYWNNNINTDITVLDIENKFRISRTTAISYLKKGTEIGWCNYNNKKEMIKNGKRNVEKQIKNLNFAIDMFDINNNYINTFLSAHEIERLSEKLFGTKLNYSNIRACCRGDIKSYKNFIFKDYNKINQN